MNRAVLFVAALAVLLTVGTLKAHDGHDHIVMGTVTARSDKRIDVKTPGGEVLAIAVNDKTTTLRDKKKISFKDVQVGRRVVVNIGNGEDPLIAREIQLGIAPAAAGAPAGH